MIDIEVSLKDFPLVTIKKGENLLTQGEKTDSVYFLEDGEVRISRDDYELSITSAKGAVFGEMSIMLGNEHSATVQCLRDSTFYCIDNPRKYLKSHPDVIWHIGEILSLRLHSLNQYLVDVRRRYDGDKKNPDKHNPDDRLKMMEDVLKILQIR